MAKGLNRAFYALFFVSFAWLFLHIVPAGQSNRWIIGAVGTALAALCIWLFVRLGGRIDAMDDRRFRRIVRLVLGVQAVLLCAAGYLLTEVLIMDLKVVYEAVPQVLESFTAGGYFVVCNNNTGLLLLLSLVFWILSPFGIAVGTDAALTAAIVFNALMIFSAVWLTYRCARHLFSRKSEQLAVVLLGFFCAALYLWTPYFYTDTLSMPFFPLALLLYLRYRECGCIYKRIGYAALIAVCAVVGFAVKGSVGVVVIAFAIHALLEHRFGWKQAVAAAAVAVALFAGLLGFYKWWQGASGLIDFSVEQDIGLPTELWFLYGSHTPGSYWQEDLDYCLSFDGYDARQAALRQRIIEVYSAYTPATYIDSLTEKAVTTWGDGKFDADLFLCTPYRVNFTHRIILEGQTLYKPYTWYTQGFHLMLLAMFAAGLFARLRRGVLNPIGFAHLCIFGVMLFLGFWETAPRYGLNVLPLLFLCAADGLFAVSELFTKRQKTDTAPKRAEIKNSDPENCSNA